MTAQYYCCLQRPAYPTIIQRADICFGFGPLLAGFFGVEAVLEGLTRHASTNTRLRVSLLFDCKIQLHKQFISPISLVLRTRR